MTPGVEGNVFGLRGRVCAVTGAGSGIGRATAMLLAAHGANVAALDRDMDACVATVEDIVERGGRAIALACDVSKADSVALAARSSEELLGPCDALVNCAGVLRAGALESVSEEAWNAVLSVNVTGTLLCSQEFGRQMMRRKKGALVHIASLAAAHAAVGAGAYSVSKAAVAMLSRQLALEWAEFGIRSNTISPGMILTAMTKAAYERPGMTEQRSLAVPAGRLGRPEDIAEVALFLVSDLSGYVNAEDIAVDGGFTRNLMGLMPRTAQ